MSDEIKIDKIVIENNSQLTKYIEEFNEDVKLTKFNLREKSLMCSSIWAKWVAILFRQKSILEEVKNRRDERIKELRQGFKDSVLQKKNDMNNLNTDEKLIKYNKIIKITDDIISYIERSLNILQNFGYNIRTSVEVQRLNLE